MKLRKKNKTDSMAGWKRGTSEPSSGPAIGFIEIDVDDKQWRAPVRRIYFEDGLLWMVVMQSSPSFPVNGRYLFRIVGLDGQEVLSKVHDWEIPVANTVTMPIPITLDVDNAPNIGETAKFLLNLSQVFNETSGEQGDTARTDKAGCNEPAQSSKHTAVNKTLYANDE